MSVLTQALERILHFLEQYAPKEAASFQPGLTRSEIENLVRNIPFQLPEEVYELYQWRNGNRKVNLFFCFGGRMFLPLDEAIERYQSMIEYNEGYEPSDPYYYNTRWFPIFWIDDYLSTVVMAKKPRKSSWVIEWASETDIFPVCYTSLTNMMLTIAECCSKGAYYINETGERCIDSEKATAIDRKYNRGIDSVWVDSQGKKHRDSELNI